MTAPQASWLRKLLILPPMVLGVAVLAFFVANRRQGKQQTVTEVARVLRVIEVPSVNVVPRVRGHGTARPGGIWRAVARVEGYVTQVHPNLTSGSLIKKDEELLQIDPAKYRLIVAQLEAEIEEATAQLAQMDARKLNYEASLKIEQQAQILARRELETVRGLAQQNAASQERIDVAEDKYLAKTQSVQAIKNSLNTWPAEKMALQASLDVKKSKVEQARIDLASTTIKAPFACRLGEAEIEKGQYVTAGEKLFEGHSIDLTEIDVQIPLEKARALVHSEDETPVASFPDFETIRQRYHLQALVRLHVGSSTIVWEGRVTGIREQIDPLTRTMSVVIAVDRPYEKVIPGKRPALIKGAFTEVELRARALENRLVIPRAAYHDGYVHVVNKENRLQRHPVEVAFPQSGFLVIRKGLKVGERVVVSDPTPAIEGMLVDPVADTGLQEALVADALGEGEME